MKGAIAEDQRTRQCEKIALNAAIETIETQPKGPITIELEESL